MPSDVNIIYKASNEASATIDAVNRSIDETDSASKKTGLSMTELTSAFALAERGLGYLQGAFDQTVGEVINYANEVRGLMQVTGAGAEETSRLIQVLDDYKVSTEAATNAQRYLTKQGITLTTESLAELSDQYLKTSGQAEKNAFAQKMLGRDYKSFIEVLQQGPDAIREMSNAVDDNLILTQKSVDQARIYEKQVDDLGDAWLGFKIKAGQDALPFVVAGLNNFTEAMNESSLASAAFNFGFDDIIQMLIDGAKPVEESTVALEDNAVAMDDAELSAEELADQEKKLADAIRTTTDENKNYLKLIDDIGSAQDNYTKKQEEFTAKRAELESELATLRAQGYWEQSDQIQGTIQKLDDLTVAEQDAATEFELAGRRRILSMLEQKLSIGGLEDAEMAYLLDLGLQWGVYSETAVTETEKAMAAIRRLSSELLSVPGVDYQNTGAYQSYEKKYGGQGAGYAEGTGGAWMSVPQGHNDDSFPIRLKTGEQFAVRTAGQSAAADSGMDIASLARMIGAEVAQAMQAAGIGAY